MRASVATYPGDLNKGGEMANKTCGISTVREHGWASMLNDARCRMERALLWHHQRWIYRCWLALGFDAPRRQVVCLVAHDEKTMNNPTKIWCVFAGDVMDGRVMASCRGSLPTHCNPEIAITR
jgi:hypothetical protein